MQLEWAFLPSLTGLAWSFGPLPSDESLGYYQASLRDGSRSRAECAKIGLAKFILIPLKAAKNLHYSVSLLRKGL